MHLRMWIILACAAGCTRSREPAPSTEPAASRAPTLPQQPPSSIPVRAVADAKLAAPRVARIFGGPRQQCLVLDGGHLQCWGYGRNGEIGDGDRADRATPTDVQGIDDAIDVALGDGFSCVARRSGSVACWGKNDQGQLGDGTLASHALPAPVNSLAGVVAIGAGNSHACALLGDGSVTCWGANDHGQLGDGTNVPHALPTRVRELAKVDQLAVGGDHACARIADRVWCWGANELGELGLAGRSIHALAKAPIVLPNLTGVVELAAGLNHTCVRLGSGSVSCWGWNEECQSGSSSKDKCLSGTPCTRVPTEVPGLTDVTQLALSAMHACARHTDGTISCWGDDPAGFKPDNTVDSSVPRICPPRRVTSIADATQIATYWGGTCALRATGAIDCWGSNWFGELGDGTTIAHPIPAPIKR